MFLRYVISYLPKPSGITLQLDITSECNLSCKHCDRWLDSQGGLSTSQLNAILQNWLHLIKAWGLPRENSVLYLSGGEPLLSKEFDWLVGTFAEHKKDFRWFVLSNGTLVTREIAKKIKQAGASHFQVSLEGMETANDSVRGIGCFEKAVSAIKILLEEGLRTSVSLTLTKNNVGDVWTLVEFLKGLGVSQLNARRLTPVGAGALLRDQVLGPTELRDFYMKVLEFNSLHCQNDFFIFTGCESAIAGSLAGWPAKFLCAMNSGCLLHVRSNGDVLPCVKLPFILGNALNTSFFEMWHSSDILCKMRDATNVSQTCRSCGNFQSCLGGAKCMSYHVAGDLFKADPGCWIAKDYC